MKQSAARTLGVAALGAAFAAAGAGAANAAPVPDVAQGLGTVTQAVPVETVVQTLPAPAGDVVTQAAPVVEPGTVAAQPVADQALSAGDQVSGLLGGLPVNPPSALPVQGLPTQGTGLNGLPL
ncbi:ATP-binding protein [Streptomyces sp. NPDC018693]|uniref:ATP-binding protein n=1 Tax=unclassified Streptomyces TaxID=2593676 RepID=UPI00379BC8C3